MEQQEDAPAGIKYPTLAAKQSEVNGVDQDLAGRNRGMNIPRASPGAFDQTISMPNLPHFFISGVAASVSEWQLIHSLTLAATTNQAEATQLAALGIIASCAADFARRTSPRYNAKNPAPWRGAGLELRFRMTTY